MYWWSICICWVCLLDSFNVKKKNFKNLIVLNLIFMMFYYLNDVNNKSKEVNIIDFEE